MQDDLFVYGRPGETLLQFEGSGIETDWELDLPIAANSRGLRSATDVVITLDMNASYSQALAGRLAASPPAPVARSILLSAGVVDSKRLSNLQVGTGPARVKFDIEGIALPAQEKNRKVTNLALLAVGKTEKTYSATLKAKGAQAAFQIKDGLAMSNAGNLMAGAAGLPLNALVGIDLDQSFTLEIDRANVQ